MDLMLKDLGELIAIRSVMEEPCGDNAPFGKPLRTALDWFLNKAREYGLSVGELDGYCGWAEYGDGDNMIGILGHLDVVPEGEGWSCPPYNLTNRDGVLFGRGIVDNKGPIIVALHILKELKDNNIKTCGRIRLIVGCNEENGSLCMKHYAKFGKIPNMSIVPDADFPLINSEKGILHLCFSTKADEFLSENVLRIFAGDRANVVPDRARVELKKGTSLVQKLKALQGSKILTNELFKVDNLRQKIQDDGHKIEDFFIEEFEDKIVVKTNGISGHAMHPELADNAIYKILSFLTALNAPITDESISSTFVSFSKSCPAKSLKIEASDEKSGELTLNLGAIKYEQNQDDNLVKMTLDLRLPISVKKDEIIQKISSVFPKSANLKILTDSPNLYIDEETPLVKTLLNVYNSIMETNALPKQTGGGTYAKSLKNAVAFGPTFPDMISNIHNADENISIENFSKLFKIYKKAIEELDKTML